MIRVRPLGDLLALFAGPAVWFAHFAALYAAEALVCTPGVAPAAAMAWVAAAATVAALAILCAFGLRVARRPAREPAGRHGGAAFLRGATLWLAALSGIAVIWVAFPLTVLPVCASAAG